MSFTKRKFLAFSVVLIICSIAIYKYFIKKPLISVVITSYNYAQYLPETFDSVLAQTYKDYEVIVVDDGSTDNSLQIIKNYADKYKNFYLYQHDGGINKGLIESMKLGIEKSKGVFIAFLESDDMWREDKLSEIVKIIKKNPDAVIISNGAIPFGDDFFGIKETQIYLLDIERRLKEKNIISPDEDILLNVIPTFSAVTIKTDVLKELDFNTPKTAVLDLWLYRQIYKNYPLYHTSKTLTKWRKHIKSYGATQNKDTEKEKNILLNKFQEKFMK